MVIIDMRRWRTQTAAGPIKSHADPAMLFHPTTQNAEIWYYRRNIPRQTNQSNHTWANALPKIKAVRMRYIAFKRHLILISFDVVIAGKENPAGESGKERQSVIVIDHILWVEDG